MKTCQCGAALDYAPSGVSICWACAHQLVTNKGVIPETRGFGVYAVKRGVQASKMLAKLTAVRSESEISVLGEVVLLLDGCKDLALAFCNSKAVPIWTYTIPELEIATSLPGDTLTCSGFSVGLTMGSNGPYGLASRSKQLFGDLIWAEAY